MAGFDERDVRLFLVHAPKPAKVIVHTAEEVHEIIPGTGKTWTSIAHTIVALEANFIEVFAADGTLARALRADDKAPGSAAALPSLPLNADPETARLMHFANLLFRATEFSTTLAFDKMCDLFERLNERSQAIEQRLERTEAAYRRTLNEQLREAFEAAAEEREGDGPPDENPIMAMARAFFEGADVGGKAKRKPPGAPNGANGAPAEKGSTPP